MAGKLRLRHLCRKQRTGGITRQECETKLRKGDPVMVITGGSPKTGKVLKGQVGRILKILPKKNRVIVEGVNMITRHKRATRAGETGGKIRTEGSIHLSNIMYYAEAIRRPVRIKAKLLEDGRKVRGYVNPDSKAFEQIDV